MQNHNHLKSVKGMSPEIEYTYYSIVLEYFPQIFFVECFYQFLYKYLQLHLLTIKYSVDIHTKNSLDLKPSISVEFVHFLLVFKEFPIFPHFINYHPISDWCHLEPIPVTSVQEVGYTLYKVPAHYWAKIITCSHLHLKAIQNFQNTHGSICVWTVKLEYLERTHVVSIQKSPLM